MNDLTVINSSNPPYAQRVDGSPADTIAVCPACNGIGKTTETVTLILPLGAKLE